jgi:hypothetical protein
VHCERLQLGPTGGAENNRTVVSTIPSYHVCGRKSLSPNWGLGRIRSRTIVRLTQETAIPSSNCAAHSVLAQWRQPHVDGACGRCGWGRLEAKLACRRMEGRLEMRKSQRGINPASKPSGNGCVECLASPKGWWLHLRRCAKCGHIGCCDSSPSQHASKHAATTGHPIIASFEPGEDWFYDYEEHAMIRIKGVELFPPHSHPEDQPSPGPAGRVPANWESLLH